MWAAQRTAGRSVGRAGVVAVAALVILGGLVALSLQPEMPVRPEVIMGAEGVVVSVAPVVSEDVPVRSEADPPPPSSPGRVVAAPGLAPGLVTGEDYMRATVAERSAWLAAVAKAALPGASPARHAVVAVRIGTCLDSAMTYRVAKDRVGAAALRASPLAEVTALCAMMIEDIARGGR